MKCLSPSHRANKHTLRPHIHRKRCLLGTSSLGTVVRLPSRVSVRSGVASTLVVFAARAVARASVRAVSSRKSKEDCKGSNEKEKFHC